MTQTATTRMAITTIEPDADAPILKGRCIMVDASNKRLVSILKKGLVAAETSSLVSLTEDEAATLANGRWWRLA